MAYLNDNGCEPPRVRENEGTKQIDVDSVSQTTHFSVDIKRTDNHKFDLKWYNKYT